MENKPEKICSWLINKTCPNGLFLGTATSACADFSTLYHCGLFERQHSRVSCQVMAFPLIGFHVLYSTTLRFRNCWRIIVMSNVTFSYNEQHAHRKGGSKSLKSADHLNYIQNLVSTSHEVDCLYCTANQLVLFSEITTVHPEDHKCRGFDCWYVVYG
jgi:hypothetical protein